MISISQKNLNTLILCAFRYALGRKSYIVDDIAELIMENIENLTPHIKHRICKEIIYAIDTHNYGMDIDREIWNNLLSAIQDYDE